MAFFRRVTQTLKLSDLTLSAEERPISRYNANYYCEVLCCYLSREENNKIHVVFRVRGDNSLGPLQSCKSSTLYLCDLTAKTATSLAVESAHLLSNTNQSQRGVLRYNLPKTVTQFSPKRFSFAFQYGISGYNTCAIPLLPFDPNVCLQAISVSYSHHYHWNLESRASSLGGLLWEVWAHIAEFCDVPDALVMSRVCSQLYLMNAEWAAQRGMESVFRVVNTSTNPSFDQEVDMLVEIMMETARKTASEDQASVSARYIEHQMQLFDPFPTQAQNHKEKLLSILP
eukprot:PhF_6_TR30404/c0_g1_i2/m.44584